MNNTLSLGTCAINEGGFQVHPPQGMGIHEIEGLVQSFLHKTVLLGSIAVSGKGLIKLIQGVNKGKFNDALRGTLQLTTAYATVIYLNSTGSRITTVAYQTLLLGSVSGYTSWKGIQDLTNGHFKKGCLELFLGSGGMICAGYYGYNEIFNSSTPSTGLEIPQELDLFLKKHEREISEMYTTKEATGAWKMLGHGAAKNVYSHPDSDFIVKIPKELSMWGHSEPDIVVDFKRLKNAETLVKNLGCDRLSIPQAYLIQNSEGPFVLQKRFDFMNLKNVNLINRDEIFLATFQLGLYTLISGHCDLRLGQNANFLTDAGTKIGIYDFDCNDCVFVIAGALLITGIKMCLNSIAKDNNKSEIISEIIGLVAGCVLIASIGPQYVISSTLVSYVGLNVLDMIGYEI